MTNNRKFRVEDVELNKIVPYERNNKIHPEEQISLLVQIMDRYGQTNDVLLDENYVILAGHARLESAKRLNWKTLRCKIFEDLTEEEKKSYRIADNKIAEMAEFDLEAVKLELAELKSPDLIDFTGFQLEEFEAEPIKSKEEKLKKEIEISTTCPSCGFEIKNTNIKK